MQTITIDQAKTNFDHLLQSGKSVIIAEGGTPVGKIISYKAYKERGKPRKFGLWEGKTWMADDFNKEDPEINKLFYGED